MTIEAGAMTIKRGIAMFRELAACDGLIAVLSGCKNTGNSGVRDVPEDMNVSPRSMEAYDPAVRELDKGGDQPADKSKDKPKDQQ
jgi:hypothetical protein